jgi:hypothetical protein
MSQSSETSTTHSRWRKRFAIGLIILGLIWVFVFGFRVMRFFFKPHFPGQRPEMTDVELIRGWMTIPYIARAYHVPEEYLFDQLGISAIDNRRKNLDRLNSDYFGGESGAAHNAVQAVILKFQDEHPLPPEDIHEQH